MSNALPAKLRITAAVLGCSRRKDLCARFRAANPGTEFDLERSHKWMQGRAAPRSSRVYDDWALVLGTRRSGSWISACAIDAFIEEVSRLFDTDQARLRDIAAGDAGYGVAGRPIAGSESATAYACYSPAWSPYFRGHLLRGSLRLRTLRDGRRHVAYRERIGATEAEFTGPADLVGRTMHVVLRARQGGYALFLSVYQPGEPASALVGVMAGSTYLAQEARPSACRFVAAQVPDTQALDASNRYFDPCPGAVAGDLASLGLPAPTATETDAAILAVLQNGAAIDQVAFADQLRIAEPIDRGWLLGAGAMPSRG